MTLL
ncbi:hypothetical protein PENARI_c008G05661 [Penicillium arizonense]|jgi:hypothetical protein